VETLPTIPISSPNITPTAAFAIQIIEKWHPEEYANNSGFLVFPL
jgi:hypothetical protein